MQHSPNPGAGPGAGLGPYSTDDANPVPLVIGWLAANGAADTDGGADADGGVDTDGGGSLALITSYLRFNLE